MMHVFYNQTGDVTGTFSGDIALLGSTVGASVEVTRTPEELGELSDWRVENGELVRVGVAAAIRLAVVEVNSRVGEARLRYITAIPGQDALYQAKLEEARAYLAISPEPETLAGFPLLSGEIGLTAPNAYYLAQLWLNMNAMWGFYAAQMERLRLTAIAQVTAATSVAEIDQHLNTLKTSLEPFNGN